MVRNIIIAVVILGGHLHSVGLADELDSVSNLAVSERPGYIASKIKEYASQYASLIMSFTATERGSLQITTTKMVDSKPFHELKLIKGTFVHELVLSNKNRYAKIQENDGTATLITYDGKEGKRYGYNKNKEMTYVDYFCDFPSSRSMSLDKFVGITGVTTFKYSANEKLASNIESFSWSERRLDPMLGDCIVLEKEARGKGSGLKREAMYFGIRDSSLVLLREEAVSQGENEILVNGQQNIEKTKWLLEFKYGRKFGKLLPESWTYLISEEYLDLSGRLIAESDNLRMNPNIIRSTTTTISNCKVLDRFPTEILNIPIDPKASLVDSCQQAAQTEVAREQKTGRWFSSWLLGLCFFSCAVAFVFFFRSRRK